MKRLQNYSLYWTSFFVSFLFFSNLSFAQSDLEVQLSHADSAFEQDQFVVALDHYERCLTIDSVGTVQREDKVLYRIGLIHLHFQNYSTAENFLSRAIELDPEFALAYTYLGMTYVYTGDFDQAESLLEKSIKIDPKNNMGYHYLAHYYLALDETKRAYDYVQKAIKLNPDFSDHYLLRGIIHYMGGKNLKALEDIDQAIVLDENYGEAYFYRALVKFELELEHCDDFKKAVDLGDPQAQDEYEDYCGE